MPEPSITGTSLMQYTPEARDDPKFGLAAEVLRGCGTIQMKAWGVSMLPSVWPGDLLTIESAAYDEIVPGDIVLMMRDNRFVIHRLVERRQDQDRFSWITRGDAMPHNDPPEVASELLGRVSGICRAHRSFAPSRRVSPLQSALAWTLCRWGPFRNLALNMHEARLQARPTLAGPFLGSVLIEGGISDTSASRASHP
jgi:signal peptidase I